MAGMRPPHDGRRLGAAGLLIRSGDGDLFGQTAAQASTRFSGRDSGRRAATNRTDRRLIIAAASSRQHHDSTEPGRESWAKTVGCCRSLGAANDWCDGGPLSPGH